MDFDVKALRAKLGYSQEELADIMGVHWRTVQNWEAGGKISKTKHTMLCKLEERPVKVNAKVDNQSEATIEVISHNSAPVTKENPLSRKTKAETKDTTIPLIPMDAHAGSLADYADSAMEYQCERFVSPIAGASCAIRIAGESMAPEYPNGSIAILKKVNEKAFIEWGKVYVLDTENGAIIKEIRKTEEKGVIECVSLNPDPKYQPFEVETDYINGWYRVLMVMSMK